MKKICKESVEPMVATIAIPKKKLDRLNDLLENGCDYEEAGIDPDSHVFSATAKFPDGIEADLNVCSEEEGSDGFWSEVCLYNEDGQEVALGEPSYGALEGEWEFEVNGNVYVVKIVAAGEDEKKLRELGQRIDEDSNKEIVPEFEKLRVEVTEVDWDLSDGAEDDVGGDDEELVDRLNDEVSKPFYFNWDTLAEYEALEQDEDGRWYLDTFVLDDLVGDSISDITGYCHNSFDYRWNIER